MTQSPGLARTIAQAIFGAPSLDLRRRGCRCCWLLAVGWLLVGCCLCCPCCCHCWQVEYDAEYFHYAVWSASLCLSSLCSSLLGLPFFSPTSPRISSTARVAARRTFRLPLAFLVMDESSMRVHHDVFPPPTHILRINCNMSPSSTLQLLAVSPLLKILP